MTNDFEIDGNGSSPTYSGDQDDDDKALRSSLHHMHLLCKGEKRFSSDTQHQHQQQKQRDRPANTYNDNCYTGPIYVLYSRSSSLCTARHIACLPAYADDDDDAMLCCVVLCAREECNEN